MAEHDHIFRVSAENTKVVRETLKRQYNGDAAKIYKKLSEFLNKYCAFARSFKAQSIVHDTEEYAKSLSVIGLISTSVPEKFFLPEFDMPKRETLNSFIEENRNSRTSILNLMYFYTYHCYIRPRPINNKEDLVKKRLSVEFNNFYRVPQPRIVDEYFVYENEPSDFSGEYILFRPSPYRPLNEILVTELLVGAGEIGDRKVKKDECIVLNDAESAPHGGTRDLDGVYITLGPTAILLVRAPEKAAARFIFYLDRLDKLDPRYPNCRGILVADTAQGDPSSAWPFIAIDKRRLDPKDHATGYRTLADLSCEYLKDTIRIHLSRGAVYWRPDQFPPHLKL